MAADFNKPVLADAYADVLSFVRALAKACTDMHNEANSNIPTGAIKYDRSGNKFQQWSGSAWVDLILAVAGGGTGAASASGARTALGLGTMATQNSNAVAITGGSISGVSTLEAAGTIAVATDDTYDLATNAKKVRKGYFKSALVIPVGTDKFATS